MEIPHITVSTDQIMDFLASKGYARTRDDPPSFRGPDNASPIVSVDADSPTQDLDHLIEDWTIVGARHLAEELQSYLGVVPPHF